MLTKIISILVILLCGFFKGQTAQLLSVDDTKYLDQSSQPYAAVNPVRTIINLDDVSLTTMDKQNFLSFTSRYGKVYKTLAEFSKRSKLWKLTD